MDYIFFEIKKFKKSGLILGSVVLTFLSVGLQGYAALKANGIKPNILYITAMDLFTSLLFPIICSFIVIRSLYSDITNNGVVNYYYKGLSIKKVFIMKWSSNFLICSILFVLALLISGIYINLKGGFALYIYLEEWRYIVLSFIAIANIINLVTMISIFAQSQLLPAIISVIASSFSSILNGVNLWYLNPWGYMSNLVSYRFIPMWQINFVVLLFIVSSSIMIFETKYITKHYMEKIKI